MTSEPEELLTATLDRIDGTGAALNAYLHVDPEGVLATAREAKAGAGPLAGVPICVKDVIDVEGMPTTAGAKGWVRHPTADAAAVAHLRRAGAVIVGKGNTNEFAFGIDGQNPHWGDCHNPRDPARMTGGSTSGPAAATAGGLAHAGIGTDTSGSLRTPASLCGLVSIRPTHGLVPTDGVVPLAPSYDTVGPIARTVADARLLLEVMAGLEPGALDTSPGDGLHGTRIGVAEQFLGEGCAGFIAGAIRAAAELMKSAGANVRSVELPALADVGEMHRTIQFFEAAESHQPWFSDQRPRYAPDVLERLERGAALSEDEYQAALRARDEAREETERATAALDAVLAPATPVTAPLLGADDVEIDGDPTPVRPALLSLTMPFTQPGGPVVAVPLGEEGGLPFGLQLLGRPGSDGTVLKIAAAYRRLAGQDEPGE